MEMLAVSYGGGTNSTALLVGLHEREVIPDVITFADTGGEKPNTYKQIETMREWLKDKGWPDIVIVAERPNGETLEEECIRRKALPAIAYGFKTCSQKYKMRPQERYIKQNFEGVGKITRAIGFDADEPQRARVFDDPVYENWYPLIEWDWGRKECIEAITRAGLPLPGKSACFYCPSSKQTEVRWLAEKHPDLMDRAIQMEENAQLTQVKGLGRNYAWKDLIATDDLFPESYIDMACGCYDG